MDINPGLVPDLTILFKRFGIALLLGLLIGAEREREKGGIFAGIRTFPLICMLGCAAAMIQDLFAPLTFLVAFVIIAAFVLKSYQLTGSLASPGITSEVSALLTFLFGALAWWDLTVFSAAAAVLTALLLSAKRPLEDLAGRLGHEDIMATLQFGVITLIILPILPNETMGPLNVLNPHTLWVMVILIAGVNLFGYTLIKILGARHGIAAAGILGGFASSTALTLAFSRRSQREPQLSAAFSLAIVIASTLMYARILLICTSVHRETGLHLIAPLGIAMLVGVLVGLAMIWLLRNQDHGTGDTALVPTSNPLEIWTAIKFGILFGLILLISRAAQLFIGNAGIYLSSLVAGFADVDAISLSLTNLARNGEIPVKLAGRGIILAATANTAMKGGIAILLGSSDLRRYLVPAFGSLIITGLLCAFLF
jgi:uncharacterized membrane protein (DUF4010 family)